MSTPRLIGIGASLLLLCGCATTHQRYDWGNYESSLYVYYKNPAERGAVRAVTAGPNRNRESRPGALSRRAFTRSMGIS